MEESKHIKLNEAKWDKWSKTVDGKGWQFDYLRRAQSSVLSLLDFNENMNFLDIGCGSGWAVGIRKFRSEKNKSLRYLI
jgi:ubiquinone/menaquinone biosynthesis C-methylase UbiE